MKKAPPVKQEIPKIDYRVANEEIKVSSYTQQIAPAATLQNFDKSSIMRSIGQELQCGICLELLNDAVTTTCMHNFCNKCMSEWNKRSKKCPTCNADSSEVKSNKTINNLINLFSQLASIEEKAKSEIPSSSGPIKCSICGAVKEVKNMNAYSDPTLKSLEFVGGPERIANINKKIVSMKIDVTQIWRLLKIWAVEKAIPLTIMGIPCKIPSFSAPLCIDCMDEAWLSMLENYFSQSHFFVIY